MLICRQYHAIAREDEINLVQALAEAFAIAYARYEDFNKLEKAKKQMEKTLVELKQAPVAIDPIGKNGFAWGTHRRHCP